MGDIISWNTKCRKSEVAIVALTVVFDWKKLVTWKDSGFSSSLTVLLATSSFCLRDSCYVKYRSKVSVLFFFVFVLYARFNT